MDDERKVAAARSNAYALLGALYLRGLTDEVLPQVRSVAELHAALPPTYDPAAAYQSVFGFNVFPHQSLFLGADFLLGGRECEQVGRAYVEAGYAPLTGAGEADHCGHELAFLAFLCGAEADALEDGALPAARRARHLQRAFLDGHLLWWLAPFVVAVQRQGDPFFAEVAVLTHALVIAHRLSLGASLLLPGGVATRLPSCITPLENPEAGLHEIAEYLATPVCSSIYLSRDDIARLARTTGLPCGFGDRRQMLTNWLRAAAEYDGVRAAVAGLRAVAAEFNAVYDRWSASDAPLSLIAAPWLQRAAHLEAVLTQLVAAVKTAAPEGG